MIKKWIRLENWTAVECFFTSLVTIIGLFIFIKNRDDYSLNIFLSDLKIETIENQNVTMEYDNYDNFFNKGKLNIYTENHLYMISYCYGLKYYFCQNKDKKIFIFENNSDKYKFDFIIEGFYKYKPLDKRRGLLFKIYKNNKEIFLNKKVGQLKLDWFIERITVLLVIIGCIIFNVLSFFRISFLLK